ncbi:MAG: SGNH/GDSL hydrolase family protein [Firmicutes bacterium]|nr:SGNH/GDSL hydrolase family protein [Bacillota bacterium]
MISLNYEAAVANRGDQGRIKSVFERAKQGEKLTLGFLGGSITQGSLATDPKFCYAYRVYEWWCRTFPNAEFVYLNAGIGATDSQFGCARVDSDLLAYRPDFVIVEFSVNDSATPHYLETYEGLVRKIYGAEWQPAVLLVHNVCYDNGGNAQLMHGRVARYYELPAVSMQSCIYPELVSGRLENRTITSDDLHPNDYGHELVASVITYFLEKILGDESLADKCLTDEKLTDESLTANAYENSVRYRNDNASPVLQGFTPDPAPQEVITDIFKKGWTASEKGASIVFEVEGSCIGVQYRKTIQLPAPVAELVLDGDEAHPFVLDANFDETWGDKLVLDTVLEHGEDKLHRVEIRLSKTHEDDKLPFYLVSVIASS